MDSFFTSALWAKSTVSPQADSYWDDRKRRAKITEYLKKSRKT